MRILGSARFWMDPAPAVEPLRLRRAPMPAAALCFAAGDVLARHWHQPWHLAFSAMALLALAVVSIRLRLRVAILPVLALWIAAGCWCAQMEPSIATQHALTQYADGLSRTARGHVVRVRRIRAADTDAAVRHEPAESIESGRMEPGAWEQEDVPALESVDLQVDAVEDVTPDVSRMDPVAGGVRVAIIGGQPSIACGETLQMPLRLRVPETYRDPGAWSYADELLRQGIGVQASVKAAAVQRVATARPGWRCRVYAAQSWAAARVEKLASSPANLRLPRAMRLSSEDSAMLEAMLFGERAMLARPLRAGFERTGTFHLFVVSGLHVAIIAGALFWFLRRMRLPEGWSVFATVALATGYALLTGFGVPVQRALGMSAIFLVARWLERDRNALNALGAAVLAILVLDPRALFESSFQMTALVIIALAGLAAPLEERLFSRWRAGTRELWSLRLDAALPPKTAQLRVQLRMWGELSGSLLGKRARDLPRWILRVAHVVASAILFGLLAEICMMLPVAVYFHRATLLALPLNAVCIPVVGVLLCAGIATFCLSLLSTMAATIPGAVTAVLLHIVRGVVGYLGRAAVADVRVAQPAAVCLALACVCLAFCCWAFREKSRMVLGFGVCAAALVPALVLWPAAPMLHPDRLEVTALDVGQGDSLLIAAPDGHTMLIDAGGPVGHAPTSIVSASEWDVGEEVVAPYLWSRRIRKLDVALLTHAHSDHMGGMAAILRDFKPRELWLSVEPGNAPGLRALLNEAQGTGTQVRWLRAGETLAWHGLEAQVLSPSPQYANAGSAMNDDSLVIRMNYGKGSVLLEGDAEARSEAAMVAGGMLLRSTLLKVGHHGSKTSTTPDFLRAVSPREAVISVGRRNTFGHPRFDVLVRLESAGVRTFRTDRAGAETFLLSPDGGISDESAASK